MRALAVLLFSSLFLAACNAAGYRGPPAPIPASYVTAHSQLVAVPAANEPPLVPNMLVPDWRQFYPELFPPGADRSTSPP